MRPLLLLSALAVASVLPGGPGGAAPARKAPVRHDWTRTVVATPQGGYRMGNPAARVKLVEYGSLTCSHCASFARQAGAPLRAHVKTGRVSWEFRPFLLFPSDPGISLLLRCRGPASFFPNADQLYADQATWSGKLQAMPPDMLDRLGSMSPQDRAGAIVRAAGLDGFFRARGMTDARIAACLADRRAFAALVAVTDRAANVEGVQGTPTFFINGAKVPNAASWAALEPALRAAIGP